MKFKVTQPLKLDPSSGIFTLVSQREAPIQCVYETPCVQHLLFLTLNIPDPKSNKVAERIANIHRAATTPGLQSS